MKYDELCSIGLTEDDLLLIHSGSISKIKSGGGELKQITSLNVPGISTGYQIEATAREMAQAAWYCLQKMNPDVYGNPALRYKRTVALPVS